MKTLLSALFTCLYFTSFAQLYDSCWSFNINAIDATWQGHDVPDIADLAPYKEGVLICGSLCDADFPSKDGAPTVRGSWCGSYIARYDKYGALKWIGHSDDSTYDANYIIRPCINSVTTDSSDNIYIAGDEFANTYFFPAAGTAFKIAEAFGSCGTNYVTGYVAKMDSNGHLLWRATMPYGLCNKMLVDKQGNLLVLCEEERSAVPSVYYNTPGLCKSIVANRFLLKLTPQGQFDWFFKTSAIDFDLDNAGNIYLIGAMPTISGQGFYSSDSSYVSAWTSGSVDRNFLVKYNSDGMYQWHLLAQMFRTAAYPTVDFVSVFADEYDNVYVTGKNDYSIQLAALDSVVVTNANGTKKTLRKGPGFMYKVSGNGMLLWDVGLSYRPWGCFHDVVTRGNEVTITGTFSEISITQPSTDLFSSTDGNDRYFTLNHGEMFVARYDTNGVLKYIVPNGSPTNWLFVDEPSKIVRGDYGNHFISLNTRGIFYVPFFCDSLVTEGAEDGVLAKLNLPSFLSANLSYAFDSCNDSCSAVATVTVANGKPPYKYQWQATGDTTNTLSNLCPGKYVVEIRDAADSLIIDTVSILPPASPLAAISINVPVFCPGDSAVVCTSALFANYNWNTGETQSCITVNAAGNYYVTVTDNFGCTAESNHVAASVFPLPNISLSVNGDTLIAYGSASYQWYKNGLPISGATGPVYVVNSPGVYSLSIADSNGCVATTSVVLNTAVEDMYFDLQVKVYPNPNISGNFIIEMNEPVSNANAEVFNVSGELVYQAPINSLISLHNISVAQGVYIVRITSLSKQYMCKMIKL